MKNSHSLFFIALIFVLSLFAGEQRAHAQASAAAELRGSALAVTEEFFRKFASGDALGMYGLFSTEQSETITPPEFVQVQIELARESGRLLGIEIVGFEWVTEESQTYARVDFRGRFERYPVFCGHIVLVEEETSFGVNGMEYFATADNVDHDSPDEELNRVMSEAGCR